MVQDVIIVWGMDRSDYGTSKLYLCFLHLRVGVQIDIQGFTWVCQSRARYTFSTCALI